MCCSQDPESPGSLGIAISEAVEDAATHDDAHYSLGSVLNHVLMHQTVIGEEALLQMEKAGEYPDVVIGCVGGGSNFAGLAFPFLGRVLRQGRSTRILAVEPEACPTLTRGVYAYDYGDSVGLAPLVKMYTLGHGFIPPAIHAGGLRYHGDAPLVCQLVHERSHPGGRSSAAACVRSGCRVRPLPRASCRHRSRRTRSGRPSTRRSRLARRANRG